MCLAASFNLKEVKMYEINKGLEVPTKHSARVINYPFAEMEATDSFFVPIEEFKDYKGWPKVMPAMSNSIRTAAKHWGNRHNGKVFTVRTIRRGGIVTGFRCWRTA